MKFLFDLFPVLVFFGTYKFFGIFAATATVIVATTLQVLWCFLRNKTVEKMLLINLAIIVVFGGATLIIQDEIFIKWKPSVLYWLFSLILLISRIAFNKNLIEIAMKKQMTLPKEIWNKINLWWTGFFVFMGIANIYVALNFSTNLWVNFKLFGSFGLLLLFGIAQALIIAPHLKNPEEN